MILKPVGIVVNFYAMTLDQFYDSLKTFLFHPQLTDKNIRHVTLQVDIQPSMVSFGGHYTLPDNTEIPVDLRKISKRKCHDFVEDITQMHRTTTHHGHTKWNKATFIMDVNGNIAQQFIWDEEFNITQMQGYEAHKAYTRQKWYWEE